MLSLVFIIVHGILKSKNTEEVCPANIYSSGQSTFCQNSHIQLLWFSYGTLFCSNFEVCLCISCGHYFTGFFKVDLAFTSLSSLHINLCGSLIPRPDLSFSISLPGIPGVKAKEKEDEISPPPPPPPECFYLIVFHGFLTLHMVLSDEAEGSAAPEGAWLLIWITHQNGFPENPKGNLDAVFSPGSLPLSEEVGLKVCYRKLESYSYISVKSNSIGDRLLGVVEKEFLDSILKSQGWPTLWSV